MIQASRIDLSNLINAFRQKSRLVLAQECAKQTARETALETNSKGILLLDRRNIIRNVVSGHIEVQILC